jgi:hypothetical protein
MRYDFASYFVIIALIYSSLIITGDNPPVLAKTLIQPTPNTAVAKPAYTLRDAAPSHHAVEAVRAIKEVMARGPERRGAHEARDQDGAQRPVNNIIILDRGPDTARRQDGPEVGRASTTFLAQQIAQEEFSGTATNLESPLAAYAETAARETIFFGLEYPLDISV